MRQVVLRGIACAVAAFSLAACSYTYTEPAKPAPVVVAPASPSSGSVVVTPSTPAQ